MQAWRSSGQSADDYARGRGFAAATLRWWSSRLGRGTPASKVAAKAKATPIRMVRLVASATPTRSSLTVRVGPVQLEVQPGFDRVLLRELVEALGSAS